MTLLIAFLSGDLFEGIPSSKTAGKTTFLQRHLIFCGFLLGLFTVETLIMGWFGGVHQTITCNQTHAEPDGPESDSAPCHKINMTDVCRDSGMWDIAWDNVTGPSVMSVQWIDGVVVHFVVCWLHAGTVDSLVAYERIFAVVSFLLWVCFNVQMVRKSLSYR